jgi:hypothetical protein
MQKLSIKEAEEFLNEHFKLFLEKKMAEGYSYQIELSPNSNESYTGYFYVKFCNESGNPENYKIVCRE